MAFIEFNALQISAEAAVAGVAFDDVEDTDPWNDGTVSVVLGFGLAIDGFDDTNPWKDCVSLSSIIPPTPVAELDLSLSFVTVDAVWMGDIECLEVSASRVDASDVECLEVSASCVDASAAELERLEMSRSDETLDNSAAERLEVSTLCVDASAAELERLEMPGLRTVDNSAARDLRLSKVLTEDLPTGGRISSGAPRGEYREGTYLPNCRSKLLAAEPAPTLANWDKVAETRSSMYSCRARVLVAGVDAGPGDMEGAHIVNNSGQKINENYFTMEDWNELLNTEDQLGPLPSWKSSGLDSPMGMSIGELEQKDAQGLMPTIFEEDSDLESVSTSDHTDSDKGPVIFCGMGRISVANDSQVSDESTHRNGRHRHPGSSKQGTMHGGAKKHNERSSSDRRKVPVKDFKRESSEIPEGGWFRATTAALSSSSSSGSDDSAESGSSDTEELGKSSKSSWKSVLRGVKIKKPFTFDGRADLDLFDQWTYEVDTWREWNGISDKMVIKILVNFMSGKASRFFMKHVALRHKDWTLKSIYEALFNHCFPPDFKLQLREQLTGEKQGRNDVRDFQRDLETLAVRSRKLTITLILLR
ncbi:hypothetical protein DFH06DRAFT_1342613 [Mycena polygramma]|nr:hypothetical protein DFH06DRAFT_1342613 [Mycena polygramma]